MDFPELRASHSQDATPPPHSRLDRLRHLLDDPRILAPHSPPRRLLALPATITLQNPSAPLDRNVGRRRHHHSPLVRRSPL